MSPDGGGWFTRLFRRPRRAAPARPDLDGHEVRRILQAYGACLEHRDDDWTYRREGELPYPKETIGRAILTALKFANRREVVEPLRHGFVALERFLTDDEWALVDEHDRLAAVGGLASGMTDERRAAAARLLAEIDDRRDRRVQLLGILNRERRDATPPMEQGGPV